ncbi:MAG TPA: DUF3089 domain-containing protein [Solirubrobacteraceae bacterium]|nr:DUF3089 domain-containing protein [Solirubrobacteraceae bacterium]
MRALAALAGATLLVLGTAATTAAAHKAKPPKTVWLCKPGRHPDPCGESLTATVVQTNGDTSVETARRARKAPIDCFYVYPTVSEQPTENANLEIEPQETQIAIDQASRFSEDCKVYAPMYPQITLAALNGGPVSPEASLKAYLGVRAAFLEYLQKYNRGRGFVLIGHSQGSLMLETLIEEMIDTNPALRQQLVSAVLLGGNVLVPEGELVGGTFQTVPACQAATETHCVIAYSSFLKEPPEGAYFGRPDSPLLGYTPPPGLEVLCVNPTLLEQNGAAGPLQPYASTTPYPGQLGYFTQTPTGSTPWVSSPGEYTAQCHDENGASWLQVNPVGTPVDPPEYVGETLGPDWGLHLYDVALAYGNLVKTVAIQAQAYAF